MHRTALVSLAAVAGSSLVASAGEPLLFTQDSRQTSASSEMLFTDDTSLMQSDATVPATLFTAFDAEPHEGVSAHLLDPPEEPWVSAVDGLYRSVLFAGRPWQGDRSFRQSSATV